MNTTTTPPIPIWSDDPTGMAVWVNGDLIELTMGDGWSGRLLPEEVAQLGAEFTAALAEATAWVERWDGVARGYQGSAA